MGVLLTDQSSGELTNQLASILCTQVIGHGSTRDADIREVVTHVHSIQNAILAQAAARAYPHTYRRLGETLGTTPARTMPPDPDPDALRSTESDPPAHPPKGTPGRDQRPSAAKPGTGTGRCSDVLTPHHGQGQGNPQKPPSPLSPHPAG